MTHMNLAVVALKYDEGRRLGVSRRPSLLFSCSSIVIQLLIDP